MSRLDPVGVIEACYRQSSSDVRWLQGIAEAMVALNHGQGLVAFTYNFDSSSRIRLKSLTEVACAHDWHETTRRLLAGAPEELALSLRGTSPWVALFSRRLRAFGPEAASFVADLFHQIEVEDLLTILAAEPNGCGAFVGVPVPRQCAVGGRTLEQLGRVSAHIVAARRLRRLVSVRAPDDVAVDAVLDPRGRLKHARGIARERKACDTLAAAVRDLDRARGRLRWTDPDAALELWKGLVDGTWSLVDHEESDGRRWVLARKNPPRVRDPKALAPRERPVLAYAAMGHSNKYIGYLLGLTPTTVATHLRCSLRKLGIASRRELIAFFGGAIKKGTDA